MITNKEEKISMNVYEYFHYYTTLCYPKLNVLHNKTNRIVLKICLEQLLFCLLVQNVVFALVLR